MAQVVEDWSDRWQQPNSKDFFYSNDRISVELDLNTFPLSYLQLKVPAETVVFSGEKLWFHAKADTVLFRKVQELSQELESGEILLTLFKEGISRDEVILKKVLGKIQEEGVRDSDESLFLVRDVLPQNLRDFFVVAILVILLILALYKLAHPYLFEVMAKPQNILNAEDFSETGSLQKFFSLDVLLFVLLVNMILALAFTVGLAIFHEEELSALIGLDFSGLMLLWGIGSLGLLLLTVFKFIGIRVIAYLFDLAKLEFAHFFYLLRLIALGGGVLILVLAFYLVNDFQGMRRVLEVSFLSLFWVYLFGVAALMLIMMNRLSFKKYHLFTYLCIAELVPFLILSKWIMELGQ
ncbi:DUF4271 domain-containing protein [Algoriphagus sp. CAU 1675]|uniref:DUF4271 domain-containing protein n=1 Tax=Algoriphagus sp. CAU 1675 TaxID=3032597 RepID=UPI0023DCA39B|nr:DUF4271 domain-containing protein [Algoriphagus sp. CAU 1675]MDF2158883.1 DUF4271 domain-containing protein [Algoriphagus sp. CAU 1675]